MKHQAMIYYVSIHSIEETIHMIDATDQTLRDGMARYCIRVVTSQESLREKAMIFETGLDDRIVEIMKLFILKNVQDRLPETNIEAVFFRCAREGELIFEILGAKLLGANIPFRVYEKLKEDYKEKFELVGDDERIIDFTWALNFVN